MLMMCRSNPTEATGMSLVSYPHIICNSPEWLGLIPYMTIYLLLVGVIFLCLGVYICKQQAIHLGSTSLKSRGQWSLISQDFRATHLFWPLVLQIKDIILNFIAAVFGILGDGMMQLVFSGVLALTYAIYALIEQPTIVFSCGVNEVWMSLAIFATIFMSAATGLQKSNGGEDPDSVFEEAEEEYALRGYLMFLVLLLGFLGPVVVICVQLLMLRPLSRKLLPKFLQPFDDESRQARVNAIQPVLQDSAQLETLIRKFDACDFKRFNGMLSTSSATIGLLDPHQRSFTPTRLLRDTLVRNTPASSTGKVTEHFRDTGATISV